ncbi:DUF6114 domain-containing protein [Actinoplanes sp. CA-030573]|uniref:DUF6114 domain-containing protein n=1 Tax=Actinoplanes sp. CA-030573 TaxID=3239898 RepID=UPI003D8BEA04
MARGSKFWHWRHARPFWGGLLVFLGGFEMFLTVKAPLPVVVHVGMQGFIGYLLPILIALLGVLLIVQPAQHVFYSLVAVVMCLASWLTSNLGGFVVGLLLGIVGSALAFAWSPDKIKLDVPDLDPLPPVERDTVDLFAGRGPERSFDRSPVDAGPVGASPVDASPVDAGPADARPADARPLDAGPVDARPVDARPVDARPVDAGPLDAGPLDAGSLDAGPLDAGPVDAGAADAGPADADPQSAAETPAVQPDTSHRRPRHRRPSPRLLSGE